MTLKPELLTQVDQLRSELASVQETNEQLSDKLGKSQERFVLAMRGANEGVWDWNLETDNVYYSPRWKSMLGYEEHELDDTLNTWKSLVHPDEQRFILDKAGKYLTGATDTFEVEMRMRHKNGHYIYIRSSAFKVVHPSASKAQRLIGYHTDISKHKEQELFKKRSSKILEMIAKGVLAPAIYDEIALLYENKHPGLRCSMLELEGDTLLHGGAPSMPEAYCQSVHGLKIGPNIGSCGASTFTGKRVLVENIETDPKWENLKSIALPFGMRCCWSEPIKSSTGNILGAFGMYYNHPALPNEEESADLLSAAMLASIVMERDQNQKRMRELAYTDELTGLSNRFSLCLSLEELINSTISTEKLVLYYLDLDDFKDINDSLGHDIGDIHLQEIAKRLGSLSDHTHTIARLGGDEFCILVNYIDEHNSILLAENLLKMISKPAILAGRKVTQTCSVGIASYPDDGQDLQSLLKAADTALYTAKAQGKGQYAFYTKSLTKEAEYKFKMEQYLREAIENKDLTLSYQTQIDLQTGQIKGVEALSRWNHPSLGQVTPMEFIPIAERIGMIKPLTDHVLTIACDQIAQWNKANIKNIHIAVNISPSHFLDADFVPLIRRKIEEYNITPCSLELEVTETVVQTDRKYLSVFNQLKELGVTMSIDDFGTGYSSFASLKHLNVDTLKIDKYFMNDFKDPKTRLLIGSMIEMAHNLGYQVVAEGIEHTEQVELLKQLGCEMGQGYLFCEPATAEVVSELL